MSDSEIAAPCNVTTLWRLDYSAISRMFPRCFVTWHSYNGRVPSSNIPGQTFGDLAPSEYPGERLGLPKEGQGSVGRFGRRILGLLIDWTFASLVVAGVAEIFPSLAALAHHPATVPVVFGVLQLTLIPTLGGSLGHRLCGMRVVPLQGGYVGFWRPLVRTALLCLVVPILVWDSDQRGFHDKIGGTVLIRG